VLSFVAELLLAPDAEAVRSWLVARFQAAVFRPETSPRVYGKMPKRADHWMAIYSLNLALLAVACGEPLRASDIWTQAQEPGRWLQGLSLGWQAAVPPSSWFEVMAHFDVRRTRTADGRNDVELRLFDGEPVERVNPLWSFRQDGSRPFRATYRMDEALRSMHLGNHRSEDVLRHLAEPLLDAIPSAVTRFTVHGPDDAESAAHSLLTLQMKSLANDEDLPGLRRAYDRAVAATAELASETTKAELAIEIAKAELMSTATAVEWLLRMIAHDAGRLGVDAVAGYYQALVDSRWFQPDDLGPFLDAAGITDPLRAEILSGVQAG
jgi:hypothetical protein